MKKLRKYDLFAHQIQLQFNKKGTPYSTTIGTLASVVVRATILLYFAYLVNKLVIA